MNIDKDSLNKLAEMSDSELRMKVLQIASACGADTKKIARKLDMPRLRDNISTMSQSDIDKIIKAIGNEKAQIIKDSIESGNK